MDDLDVFCILGAILGGSDPFVGDIELARLEHSIDFGVDIAELRGMACSFDRVSTIEGVVREGHVQEIAADNFAQSIQAGLLVVAASSSDLVVVDGDSDHVCSRVSSDGTHGASDTTSCIQNLIARMNLEQIAHPFLVHPRLFAMRLARDGRREMEALPPSPLVDIRHEVVEGIHELGDTVGGVDLLGFLEESSVFLVVISDLLAGKGASTELDSRFALGFGRAENADDPVKGSCEGERKGNHGEGEGINSHGDREEGDEQKQKGAEQENK